MTTTAEERPWGRFFDLHTGTRHKVKRIVVDPGVVPLELIEVQLGPHCTEDDIIRYGDDYGRGVGQRAQERPQDAPAAWARPGYVPEL